MNINEYFENIKSLTGVIVVMSAKDEASCYSSKVRLQNNLNLDVNINWRESYVAVVDMKRKFVFEKAENDRLECSYKVGDKYIDIVSAHYEIGNISSIKIGSEEFSLNRRGLNVVVFDSSNLNVVDRFYCDLYEDEDLEIMKK